MSDDRPGKLLKQDEEDDLLISDLLNGGTGIEDKLGDILNRDLEVGEKADDAIDFEDISDGDLASDDDAPARPALPAEAADKDEDNDLEDIFSGDPDDDQFGDLFGEASSPPPAAASGDEDVKTEEDVEMAEKPFKMTDLLPFQSTDDHDDDLADDKIGESAGSGAEDKEAEPDPINRLLAVDDDDPETREQFELFRRAREECDERMARAAEFAASQRKDTFSQPQTWNDLFQSVWPEFDPDERPYFNRLLVQKRAFYTGKVPAKPPKPIHPTRLSLELAADQEKQFRLPGPARDSLTKRVEDGAKRGVILIEESQENVEVESEDDSSEIDWEETIAGVKMHELATICADMELPTPGSSPKRACSPDGADDDLRPNKVRKTESNPVSSLPVFFDTNESLDEPERVTAHLSRRVIIEESDPYLLLDRRPAEETIQRTRTGLAAGSRPGGRAKKDWAISRYNISNDSAYDLLKDNHSSKVRSNLGNLAVEHSLPAARLQYPFFKVKLSLREARTFHRPKFSIQPNTTVSFNPVRVIKRKTLKGKTVQQIYATTKDLNLGDNSAMVLLEYSEEYPTSLSNFGMASRLINYYRKQDADDTNRPKLEVGETVVLLPEDKSPFSIFGNVEAGQQTPTIHNGLFRAPIFKHTTKSTDFYVSRSTTGVYGSEWFIRPLDHIFAVGQQLPSVEVPGTHSRKVTEASKRRLRMISYRVYDRYVKRGPTDPTVSPLTNEIIRKHLPGTDIAQNRGKMREFMQYDKETCTWALKKGDTIPDMQTLRSWIKPEDVCLLDSMQVGHRLLLDAGYQQDDVGEDDRDGMSMEQKLAPWNTTKNFLLACQGKAMLELHGEGDPSGRGEAFSFIKTSMKGGFKPIGESIEDRLDAKRLKDRGGHTYSVAKQQKAYHDAIKRIWDSQMHSLSSTIEQDELEQGVDDYPEDGTAGAGTAPPTGTSESAFRMRTPKVDTFAHSRRDDESVSQFSRFSSASQPSRTLKISRTIKSMVPGQPDRIDEVEITDPKVIKEYLRRRRQQELNAVSLHDLKPTGDPEIDAHHQKRLLEELARLERNKDRRGSKLKGKTGREFGIPGTPDSFFTGGVVSASLSAVGSVQGSAVGGHSQTGTTSTLFPGSKPQGTQRRCANCGQVGHIKTNKKLCPMLNGKMKPDESAFDQAAFGAVGGGESVGEANATTVVSTPTPLPAPFAPPAASPA